MLPSEYFGHNSKQYHSIPKTLDCQRASSFGTIHKDGTVGPILRRQFGGNKSIQKSSLHNESKRGQKGIDGRRQPTIPPNRTGRQPIIPPNRTRGQGGIAGRQPIIPPNRTRGQGGIAGRQPIIPPNTIKTTQRRATKSLTQFKNNIKKLSTSVTHLSKPSKQLMAMNHKLQRKTKHTTKKTHSSP
jgi:hypothetical protein